MSSSASVTIPDPIPLNLSLAHFSRVMISRTLTASGPWLRLRRNHPGLTDVLLALHFAAQERPGFGLEDDSDTLAHLACIPPDEWMADWDVLVRRHLVRGESGLLYVRLLLPDAQAEVAIHQRNQARTQAGRAKQAQDRAERAADSADDPPSRKPRRRAKPATDPPVTEPRDIKPEAATNPLVTQSSRVPTDSLPPEPPPRRRR